MDNLAFRVYELSRSYLLILNGFFNGRSVILSWGDIGSNLKSFML